MAERGDIATGPLDAEGRAAWVLFCGDWREALPVPDCPHSIVTDVPFSARTHAGHDKGGNQVRSTTGQRTRRALDYGAITPDDLHDWVKTWASWDPAWLVVQMSHDLVPAYEAAARAAGRYVFAPAPIIQKRPRLLGDGPASWCVYQMASRLKTREAMRWRCLPGAYESRCEKDAPIVGAKPLRLMRSVVCDYSDPDHVVVDPCAGWGTTLLAAMTERRRAVGCERDPERFELAVARLRSGGASRDPRQVEMFGGDDAAQ